MKIAVGIPVYNDSIFLERSVQNCLDVGYDYVVYLDDGSTDDTYEKLVNLISGYQQFKVIKNDRNTIFSNNGNRWEIVSRECQKANPDWIMVRAADECLSYSAFDKGKNLLRSNLEILNSKGVNAIVFSYVDLWRSKWWYRVDGFWGSHRNSINMWKNSDDWVFEAGAALHKGRHRPIKIGKEIKQANINLNKEDEIVVLHYGMSSHELLARKLDYQISTALKVKDRSFGVPIKIPLPRRWCDYNGYKIAHELGAQLVKVKQVWFKDPIPDNPKPQIKSLYDVILKYDMARAEEYAVIYGR